ncbi:Type-B carboxylesterase lipase family [Teratosphaeria destructans]|uniref:Carboxylic ester hydrolase n=1 Tax=Teratosphaeria destructans TaxID=418781 RepID=A0A9W7SWP7_9PEZI|nr:Type-B carboxylesterase lipase family [Teratosphaeria destructans]
MVHTCVLLAALLGIVANAAPQQYRRNNGGRSCNDPTVTIQNGSLAGVHNPTYNQDFFLGVPFAQPPTGENRFRIPQSINSTFHATHQATAYAPECVGYGGDQIGYPVSEDCLYLNVIRPAGYENQSLPVGVWIHGGGLYEGGTRDERYNLSFIVENSVEIGKPFIGVSIAYRLSTWGFLASAEVQGSGNTNLGLRDQRLALHWLQENIGAFGGDPSQVTIWGESAGAGSVGWHLTAYNGRDDKLFRAGIMESGNPINYNSYRTDEHYQPLYDALVANVSCTDTTDTLDCLRHVPFSTLNAVLNSSTYATSWTPVVDGDFIARWSSLQLAEGDFVKVSIIDGANTDEGTAFGPSPVTSQPNFTAYATENSTSVVLPEWLVPQLLDAYPETPAYYIPPVDEVPANATFPASLGDSDQHRRSAAYFGDVIMIANRRGTVETWAANGVPAYSYRFNTIPAGIAWDVGVTHFQEVAFVFDNTQGLGYNAAHDTINPFTDKPQSYDDLAKLMSSSWASFIHDLNPNNFTGRSAGAAQWPEYSVGAENIVWDANATALAYAEPDTFRAEGIRFILDHALAYHR